MGFFNKLKGELIDIVEWIESGPDVIAYRFERYGNEIKNGAKLTVREGQWAGFVNEGSLADVFEPGMYTLTTENLPVLSTLKGWAHGFRSPFKAEVYFITRRHIPDLGWGTASPFYLPEPKTGADIEVTARGTFSFVIANPEIFIRNVIGTQGRITKADLQSRLRDRIVTHLIDTVGEAGLSVFELASRYREFGELVATHCRDEFMVDFGLEIQRLSILNIGLPEEYREMMREVNRMRMLSGQTETYQAIAQADAMKAMAANPGGGGAAGDMMGMGMGLAMANQMAQGFGRQQHAAPGAPAAGPPPPPPQTAFHVYQNGQQLGPIAVNALAAQIQNGQLAADTLVWKNGMAGWTPAGQVPELAGFFGATPPPPPPPPVG